MSGGHFDFKQWHILDIAEELQRIKVDYTLPTQKVLEELADCLISAHTIINDADKMICGDHDEDDFLKMYQEPKDVN